MMPNCSDDERAIEQHGLESEDTFTAMACKIHVKCTVCGRVYWYLATVEWFKHHPLLCMQAAQDASTSELTQKVCSTG